MSFLIPPSPARNVNDKFVGSGQRNVCHDIAFSKIKWRKFLEFPLVVVCFFHRKTRKWNLNVIYFGNLFYKINERFPPPLNQIIPMKLHQT